MKNTEKKELTGMKIETIAEIKKDLPTLGFTLVVKSPFRNYRKGNHIIDREEIDKILSCHEKNMVIKSANQ